MSDIFISYSRKDSEQALLLAERLRNEGMSVWIDQHGIGAAKTWTEEIVNAIERSQVFVLLLSSRSLASENVAKELSIASEQGRPLLPVVIEDVVLTARFKYALAGIQRVAYSQFDAIRSALHDCGIVPGRDQRIPNPKHKETNNALLVLPFEDLSPSQDNLWFAEGLAEELIDKLSHVRTLKVIDKRTSRQLRHSRLSNFEIASALSVQYVIEGSVRKFGEQIRISTALLNIVEGEYLWQESHKGVMDDVFDLQDAVADKVIESLKLHLGQAERQAMEKQPTNDAEAYEYFLRALQFARLYSRDNYRRALDLLDAAIERDPTFSFALGNAALSRLEYHRLYDRDPAQLAKSKEIIDKVYALEGESGMWCWLMSHLTAFEKDLDRAEYYARKAIEKNPENAAGYGSLAHALHAKGDLEAAAEARGQFVRIRQDPNAYFNYLITLFELNEPERLGAAAVEALPVLEKHLKLNPDDTSGAVKCACAQLFAGHRALALERASNLSGLATLDPTALLNLAGLLAQLGELEQAMAVFQGSISGGYADIDTISSDRMIDPLRELPQFKALMQSIEAKQHNV